MQQRCFKPSSKIQEELVFLQGISPLKCNFQHVCTCLGAVVRCRDTGGDAAASPKSRTTQGPERLIIAPGSPKRARKREKLRWIPPKEGAAGAEGRCPTRGGPAVPFWGGQDSVSPASSRAARGSARSRENKPYSLRLSNCHGNRSPARPEHLSLQSATGAGSHRCVKRGENPRKMSATASHVHGNHSSSLPRENITFRPQPLPWCTEKSPRKDVFHPPPSRRSCFNCNRSSRAASFWGARSRLPLKLQGIASG